MAGRNSQYAFISNYDKNKKYSVKITPRIVKTFQKFNKDNIIISN